MQTVRLALIGFGNVGQGLVQILYQKADAYAEKFGFRFSIVAITDLFYGSAYDPQGLDLSALLNIPHQHMETSPCTSPHGNHWDA